MSERMYYIQCKGACGNCVLWWGKNRRGYVTDLERAGLYPEAEAMSISRGREIDVVWAQEAVDAIAVRHVILDTLRELPEVEHG